MVKKSSGGSKKGGKTNIIPPSSITGYPVNKPCKCPSELLRKAAGGGKASGA
jgi:hypothetical protein